MKKLVLGLVLGCAVLGAAVWFVPQVRMAALVAIGRSGACDLSHAMAIQGHFKEEMAVKDRILAASKKLQTDGEFEQWETPHGTFWIPVGSKFVLPFNLAEQVLQIYGTGEQAVRPGDVVLDGGANIGVFVKFALNAGAKTVVAIEPGPENIECLRRNFAKEIAEGRVIVYPKGIWDKEEMLTLRVDPTNSAADSVVLQTATQTKSVQVPLTTIDKMVAELNLPKVDYIKFDIEGAEPNALRGGDQTIRKYKPRLSVSAYHAADHATVIPAIVNGFAAGYKMACGPCNESREEFLVRPEILYFR